MNSEINMDRQKVFLLLSKQPEQYSSLGSLLIEDGWRVVPIVDTRVLTNYTSKQDAGDGHLYCLGIFNSINQQFSQDDLHRVQAFRLAGNSLIIAGCENRDKHNQTNINEIISTQFGVQFNEDCVIRPNPYRHYHPKEALLEDFIVNRGFSETLKKNWQARDPNEAELIARDSVVNNNSGPRLLYAHGCSLNVLNRASTIMLTSSQWAIPCRQAICAFHAGNRGIKANEGNQSRAVIVGSAKMMNNRYFDMEDNKAIIRTFIEYIMRKDFPINISDAKTIEMPEMIPGPDVGPLIDMPVACLQVSEQLPDDKMSLINRKLFCIDGSKLPTIVRAYQDLNVTHEPLTLIKPDFQHKQLKLEPATHGFLIRRPHQASA